MDGRGETTDVMLTTMHNLGITNHKRKFSLGPNVLPDIDEDDDMKDLLNKTWTLWEVSSLFNCELYDKVKLKLYGKTLREELATTLYKDNVIYYTKFQVLKNMTLQPNLADSQPLKIEVNSRILERKKEVNVYTGIFISWRLLMTDVSNKKCVNLPVLLSRGTPNTVKAVHGIISRMFDCIIATLSINQIDLKWILPIVLKRHSRRNESDIIMEYRIPGFPTTDTITTKFKISDLKPVLKAIFQENTESDETEMTLEQVDTFFNILHSHMLYISGLKLGKCSLHKMSTPSLTISENKMKALDKNSMYSILLFLHEKATDDLHPFLGNM